MKNQGKKAYFWSGVAPELTPADLVRMAFASVMIGGLYVLYHLLGNSVEVSSYTRSVFRWTTTLWGASQHFGGTDYSHGYIIPLISLWAVWRRRKELLSLPKKESLLGFSVIVLALALHWLGVKAQQPRVSLFSLVLMIWGLPFFFLGWPVAKRLIFPCSYLILCIPLNFLDSITFPLRLFSTVIATAMLNGLGITAHRNGSAIYSAADGGFNFDVADPCSGIHSILAMTAITAAYAWWSQRTLGKQWILFLSSIPLAIVGNISRIVTIAIVAVAFGQDIALKIYHDYSGYVFFTASILVMIGIGQLLQADYRKAWVEWKRAHMSPP